MLSSTFGAFGVRHGDCAVADSVEENTRLIHRKLDELAELLYL